MKQNKKKRVEVFAVTGILCYSDRYMAREIERRGRDVLGLTNQGYRHMGGLLKQSKPSKTTPDYT